MQIFWVTGRSSRRHLQRGLRSSSDFREGGLTNAAPITTLILALSRQRHKPFFAVACLDYAAYLIYVLLCMELSAHHRSDMRERAMPCFFALHSIFGDYILTYF